MQVKTIKTDKYLSHEEIQKHLENVEYIIMVAPAPQEFKKTPIHFSIFLNTNEAIPTEFQKKVLDKFREEHHISKVSQLLSQLMPIGFALSSNQETPMPMLLVNKKDQISIPSRAMFIFDFLADSPEFVEAKEKSLTGWSYSYS